MYRTKSLQILTGHRDALEVCCSVLVVAENLV